MPLQRHQIIESLMAQRADKGVDAAIRLWEQMAGQIVSIVGEGGFNSLYARSIFIAQTTFHWLAVKPSSPLPDQRFAELKSCLEGQPPMLANVANTLLLITFTDILATLIGEQLTERILSTAWDHGALDRADKETE